MMMMMNIDHHLPRISFFIRFFFASCMEHMKNNGLNEFQMNNGNDDDDDNNFFLHLLFSHS